MSIQFEKMQLLLADMRANYLAELPERINKLDILLLNLEVHPDDQEQYNELYRNIHSMKGNGGTYGIDILSRICHQMENLLPEIQGEKEIRNTAIASLLLCVDLLRDTHSAALNASANYIDIETRLTSLYRVALKNKKSIVIAESSSTLAEVYRKLLSQLPIQITCINDGMPALEHLLRYPCDLVIVGKELKNLNAYALMAALRHSNSINQRTPAILLTSSQEASNDLFSVTIVRDKHQAEKLLSATRVLLKADSASG